MVYTISEGRDVCGASLAVKWSSRVICRSAGMQSQVAGPSACTVQDPMLYKLNTDEVLGKTTQCFTAVGLDFYV